MTSSGDGQRAGGALKSAPAQADATARTPPHSVRSRSRRAAGRRARARSVAARRRQHALAPARRFRRRRHQGGAATGDPLRDWRDGGQELHWKTYARNKRSIVLNFRHAAAQGCAAAAHRHRRRSIENFRPGTLEQMGLGPDVLLAKNPGLVIVRVSGFGQTGPYAPLPGFGTLVEAMSGFAARTGFADREPVLPPLALADMIAGLYGAFAVVTALRARDERAGARRSSHRPLAPGIDVLGAGAGSRDLPAHRRGEGARRQRLQHFGAAQRLSLRGRRLRRAVGFDRHHGATGVRGDRPSRHWL